MEKKISLSISNFLFFQNQILEQITPKTRHELSWLLSLDQILDKCTGSFIASRNEISEKSKKIVDENERSDFLNVENKDLIKKAQVIKFIVIDQLIYDYVYPKIDKFLEQGKLIIPLMDGGVRDWSIAEYKLFNNIVEAFEQAETIEQKGKKLK
jgi:hypothetical protein